MLGKIYLTQKEWQKAADKFGEIVNSESIYGYELHEDYRDNWNLETSLTKESVFSIDMSELIGNGNRLMQGAAPKYSVVSPKKTGLGAPWESDVPSFELMSILDVNDERRATTITNKFPRDDADTIVTSRYLFYKYWEPNENNMKASDTDFHVIRYADVLLMYAEALNELGNTDDAYAHLNRVRERAFNNTNYNYSGLSQSEFRTVVYLERRLELAFEGKRFFDLVRTGRFVQRMKDHAIIENDLDGVSDAKLEIGQNVSEFRAHYPIPQHEIDLSLKLVQNSGY